MYVAYNVDTYELIAQGSLEEMEVYAGDEIGVCTKECYERGLSCL